MARRKSPALQILTPMSAQSPYTWVFPYWQSGAVALLGHNFVRLSLRQRHHRHAQRAGGLWAGATQSSTAKPRCWRAGAGDFPAARSLQPRRHDLIADPLFGTMALMFFARALRNNHRLEWALAGISLGMTQYFYEGGRLLFPPLLIGFVILLALRGQMRGKWRGFASCC